MRPTPRMTPADRWELGLFLSLVVVGCLLMAALLNVGPLPMLSAWKQVPTAQPIAEAVVPQNLIPAPAVDMPLANPAAVQETPDIEPAPQRKVSARTSPETKVFNGKQYRYVKTVKLRVTAYAPDSRCCYPYPGTTTASGLSVKTNGGRLVASDPSIIAMHSLVVVPGYAASAAVPVLDTGGAIKGNRLDVLLPTFEQAKAWGSRMLEVKVYAPIK